MRPASTRDCSRAAGTAHVKNRACAVVTGISWGADEHELESEALRGNGSATRIGGRLGVRAAGRGETPLPAIYLIRAHGPGRHVRNRSAFRPNVLELVDVLFADEGCPPALVVFVDAVDVVRGRSSRLAGCGQLPHYLCNEVVPFVDAHYRRCPTRRHRGSRGKSSAVRRNGHADACARPLRRVATHAGDALFEVCTPGHPRRPLRTLRDASTLVRAFGRL